MHVLAVVLIGDVEQVVVGNRRNVVVLLLIAQVEVSVDESLIMNDFHAVLEWLSEVSDGAGVVAVESVS